MLELISESLVVNTDCGKIRGKLDKNGILKWIGIPYAKPPLGKYRGRAPEPHETWTMIKETLNYGKPAIQQSLVGTQQIKEECEDCLYINVWAPADTKGKKNPF